MYRFVLPFVIAAAPALLAAQQAEVKAKARTDARVSTSAGDVSTASSADAEIALARKRGLPTRAIENRVAEGRAKGATEAQLAAAAAETRANVETTHDVLLAAGRQKASDDEVERGAEVLGNGYTRAQLEAFVRSVPSDRSLVVAFDVLTKLRARGVASEKALAQVQSKLEARAADAELEALVSASATSKSGLGATGAAASGAVGATGKAGAAVGGVKGAAGVTGGVTGTVKGVIKP